MTTDANTTPTPAAPAPKTRRPRGPNKPKTQDATIMVKIEAVISHAEILKLLNAHVVKMLDKETAAKMELQLNLDGKGWTTAWDPSVMPSRIRFATKETK